jgi:hypothetical protein
VEPAEMLMGVKLAAEKMASETAPIATGAAISQLRMT